MKFGSKSLLFLQLLAVFSPYQGLAAQPTLVSFGTGVNEEHTTGEVRHVACGLSFCIAVLMDGTMFGYGDLIYGNINFNPPAGVTNAREVSCKNNACAVLLSNGTVLGWGDHRSGGRNPGITDAKFVECGIDWCVAIRKDGTLVHYGQTSNSYINTGSPNGITNAVSASCYHSCAVLKDDGTVYTYGRDATGAITTMYNSKPLVNIKQVFCHGKGCVAVGKDGSLIAWGMDVRTASEPHVTNAVKVHCVSSVCTVLRSDGSVIAWGEDRLDGTEAPTDISTAVDVACTYKGCIALLSNGTIRRWPYALSKSVTGMNKITCYHGACAVYNSDYIAGGGGDPHFYGFGDTFFTWQSHCDAILLKSPQENEDVDIEIHVRLTKVRKWSKIDTLAFTSGDNIGEIDSEEAKLILNGRETEGFHNDSMSIAKSKIKKHIHLYTLSFPKKKTLEVKVNTRFNMIYVKARGEYPLGTQGLLGSPHNPGLISREGIMMSNKEVNEFGESWQVKNSDRKLFSRERSPQYPAKCLYDMKQVQESTGRSRNLKQLRQISKEEATNACKFHRLAPMRKFCVDDVMLTGDIEYAKDDFYE